MSVEYADHQARSEYDSSDSKKAGADIHVTTEAIYTDDENAALDPAYALKARILNDALSEIGMGRYQWALFVVTGFGWLADNLWPIVTGLILTQVVNEFNFKGPWLKLAQNLGLLVGAVFWGVGSDAWGRRPSFNITLLIVGAFAVSAGGSPNYITLSALAACWSIGVGGNLPVDSAIFLEFVPREGQYLLTVLSIWWAFGQLLGSLVSGFFFILYLRMLHYAYFLFLTYLPTHLGNICVFGGYGSLSPVFLSRDFALPFLSNALHIINASSGCSVYNTIHLMRIRLLSRHIHTFHSASFTLFPQALTLPLLQIAWPLLGNSRFSCPTGTAADPIPCPKASNMGWRYFLYTMGGLMLVLWIIRFFLFTLWESPKWLMSRGRDAEAVEVIHKVAAYNKTTSSLTLEQLEKAGQLAGHSDEETAGRTSGHDTSALGAIRRNLSKLSISHLRGLFATRRLAVSTSLLVIIWALIGLAFPLYNSFVTYYLATRGADFGDGSVYITCTCPYNTYCIKFTNIRTDRNQVILSVIGVPGALLAGWMVELPYLGRRGTLAISTGWFIHIIFVCSYETNDSMV